MVFRTGILMAVLVAFAAQADAGEGRRVRIGGISAGAGYVRGPAYWGPAYWGPGWYGPGWGPGWYRPWGPAWWDPFWMNGWMHPGFYSGFASGPGMGEVKLKSNDRDAMVYIDGAYAGTVEKLKTIWLAPGAYNLEVKDDGGDLYSRRVYVLSGKTLQLRAELKPPKEKESKP